MKTASEFTVTPSLCSRDDVRTSIYDVKLIDSENPKEDSMGRTIDQSVGGKLRDKNIKESWALIEDLALYDYESWNYPRDFAKPFKAMSLPHDITNASYRRLIELEN
ncbi:hypothetical protein Tco_0817616 [Tanacetum coccineum]